MGRQNGGAAPDSRKAELEAQLRFSTAQDPAKSVFRGCTTNPPLSLEAVKANPDYWNGQIDELIVATHPGITAQDLFWKTYKLVVQQGRGGFPAA